MRRSSWRPTTRCGTTLFYTRRVCLCPSPRGAGDGPLRSPAAPRPTPCSMAAMTPVCAAYPLGPVSCGFLAIRTRPCRGSTRRSPSAQELCAPAIAWLSPCTYAAQLHQLRREGQAAQERAEAEIALSGGAGVCSMSWRGERSCGAGRWPGRDREQRGWRRCARAWLPIGLLGQRWNGRIFWPCWPKAYRESGSRCKRGLLCWPRRWPAAHNSGRALLRSRAASPQRRTAALAVCGPAR